MWSSDSGFTNLTAGSCEQHPYLDVSTSGARSDLVSVLAPAADGDSAPELSSVENAGARGVVIGSEGERDVALTRTGPAAMELAGVESDAARLYVDRSATAVAAKALVDDGRHLVLDGRSVLQSSAPVTATLAWGGEAALTCTVQVERQATVVINLAGRRADEVRVDGKVVRGTGKGAVVSLRLAAGEHLITVTDGGSAQ